MAAISEPQFLQRLLSAWLAPLIAMNVLVIGYLAGSGLTLLPNCGAWRWFGVWQIGAAIVTSFICFKAFQLRRSHIGWAACLLLGTPLLAALSLNLLINVMAFLS